MEQDKIFLKGDWDTRAVWLNNERLLPGNSQARVNHSPDGFNWGYAGSGPSQLALAICLSIYGTGPGDILPKYQQFKFDHIQNLPQGDFDTVIEFDYNKYKPY